MQQVRFHKLMIVNELSTNFEPDIHSSWKHSGDSKEKTTNHWEAHSDQCSQWIIGKFTCAKRGTVCHHPIYWQQNLHCLDQCLDYNFGPKSLSFVNFLYVCMLSIFFFFFSCAVYIGRNVFSFCKYLIIITAMITLHVPVTELSLYISRYYAYALFFFFQIHAEDGFPDEFSISFYFLICGTKFGRYRMRVDYVNHFSIVNLFTR
jgi:hypothetical protein